MRAQEFIVEIERIDPEQYPGGKEDLPTNLRPSILRKIKPVPGGSKFGYIVERHPNEILIHIVDQTKSNIVVGSMKLVTTDYELTEAIPNIFEVRDITTDEDYRGQGVARTMYGIALTILKVNLRAGELQTPDGRRMWQMLHSIPGVELFGVVEDFYINPNIERAILKRGGRIIKQTNDPDYGETRIYAFPVQQGKDELVSAINGLDIYADIDDTGVQLVAKWTGQ